MVLRLYVHIDETQSLFLAFDLYIIQYKYSLFPCPGMGIMPCCPQTIQY